MSLFELPKQQKTAATPRPCERQCKGPCGRWKHYSRFRSWRDHRNRSASVIFSLICRACEQIQRNERKNEDRPFDIIRKRAKAHATKYGVTTDFMWITMNYQSLVPVFRALCSDEGLCNSCGHEFENERDIQLEHRCPPRGVNDYARLHARNIGIYCGSCNNGKKAMPYDEWLDKEEEIRLSNEVGRKSEPPIQRSFFDTLFDDLD
jgi:hypothetical protein